MRLLLILAILPLTFWIVAPELPSPNSPGVTPSGVILGGEEELLYEVKWTFVRLGTIRLKAHPNLSAEAYIDSYDGLPYVDLHAIHYSQMDSSLFSRGARSIEKKEKGWAGSNYLYELGTRRLIVEEIVQNDPNSSPTSRVVKDTLHLSSTSFMDGLSIGYRPRALLHTAQTVEIPTVLYGKLGSTFFYFPGEQTSVDLDAVDYPVRAVEIEGTTTVEGVFGMTGDFKGWFSDDAAAVPLKGRLKVLLGWVNVELIKWDRPGWTPPK